MRNTMLTLNCVIGLTTVDPAAIHVSVMDLPDGQAGIEWDVRSCSSFKADLGRWQRFRPGQELPR